MSENIQISESGIESIRVLENLLDGISRAQAVETALAITAALYSKSSEGARIKVEYPDGKAEELRFRVRRNQRKSGK
jgi:hypothetical protein